MPLQVLVLSLSTYSWSGPGFTSALANPTRPSATLAMGGTYGLTVTNSNNCTASGTVNVVVTASPTLTASSSSTTYCSGATIQLTSSPSGGTTPYTYTWSGPASFAPGNVQNPTRLNATTAMTGTYSVTVVDQNGCSATASAPAITVNPSPSVSASSSSPAYCQGNTIQLNSVPTGGTTPYSYAWSGPASYTANTQNPTRANAQTTHSGVYTVTVTAANGCTATASTSTVTVNPTPTITASSSSPSYCQGVTIQLNSTPVGGTSPYTYAWSGPSSFTASVQNPTRPNAQTSHTGVYSVTVTDNLGCSATASTSTVTVNPGLSVSAGSNSPACTGGTISLTSTPTGGTTPYTYTWSGPSSFSASTQNPTRTSAVAGFAGAYNVTVSDANGCSGTATTNVIVNQGVSISASSNTPVCVGSSLNLSSTPTGGTSPYSYTWSGPSSYSASTQSPTRANAQLTYAGTYNVTITDANLCSATTSTAVVVNPTPSITAGSNSPVCSGLTLNLTSTPSGGTPGYTFTWSGPSAYSTSSQNATRTNAIVAHSGNYLVTVSDVNSCTATASVSVTINPSPSVSASSSSPAYCQGNTIQLNSVPTGGTTPYSYAWSGPASYTANTQNPIRANAQTTHSGVYTVTVTAANGCTATASTSTVTVNPTPTITASSSSPSYCQGVTIQLNSTPVGGTSPYTYAWSGPSSFTAGVQNPTRTNAQTSHTGVYSVTVTDNLGCSATASTSTVTVNPGLSVSAGSNSPACTGGTISLTSTPTGGTTPYTYTWSGPSSFSASTQNPTRTSAVAGFAGAYNVTVSDANGCSGTATTNVVVNQGVSISASSNTPVCVGSSLNLSSTPTGGTSPYNYTWSGPASFAPGNVQNPTRANAQLTHAGTYNVTITDANLCSATTSTAVVVNPTPSITAGSNSPVCSGLTLNLTSTPSGGTPGYTFTWSGPSSYSASSQNATRTNTIVAYSGSYVVTVSDVNSCTATASVSVTINPSPSVSASSNSPVCETTTITLSSTPTGGTGAYGYNWSGPAGFNSSVQNPTRTGALATYAGVYSLTLTDALSCSATASTSVTILPKPTLPTAQANPNPVCTEQTLNLLGSGNGAAGWNWFGPNGFNSTLQNPSITNVTLAAAGTYSLYQTLSGCSSDTAVVVVVVNPKPAQPTITSISPNPACTGQTVTFSANGQIGATFNWTGPNGFSQTGTPVSLTNVALVNAGNYTVTQTVTGCTSNASAPTALVVNQTPIAPSLSSNSPACYGGTLELFATSVPGASYAWTGPGGFVASVQNPTRASALPSMSGTYSLNVTVNGCVSTTPSTVFANVVSCPPIAQDDTYNTPEDQTLVISAPGVLLNDSDPASQPLTVSTTPFSGPSNGVLTLNSNGSFTYDPNSNFTGADVFCYIVCDNEIPAACDTACVNNKCNTG
jgi:hypothetical protein